MSTTKSNGDSKFQKAVNEARAKESGDASGHEETAMVMPKAAQGMILRPSADDIADMMNDDSMEFAPQVKKLEEGEMIVGILEGYGPPAEINSTDPQGRPITNHVDTWIICHPNGTLRMSILSSAQLDKKLKPFIGGMVKIVRGKDVKTGTAGRRVTEYMVGGPKRPDGVRRSWVDSSPHVAIDADSRSVDAAELPPPSVSGALPSGEDAQA